MHAGSESLVAVGLLHLCRKYIALFYPDCAKIPFRTMTDLGKRLGADHRPLDCFFLLPPSYFPSKMLERLVFAIADHAGSRPLVSGVETSSGEPCLSSARTAAPPGPDTAREQAVAVILVTEVLMHARNPTGS